MASFVDDPEAQIVFGDHPVYVTPDTSGTLAILGLGVLCLFAFAQRRRLVSWLAEKKPTPGVSRSDGIDPPGERQAE
jgi:MYXO-CTERM domain-containing protein